MDYEKRMENLILKYETLHDDIKISIEEYKEALESTNKFLEDCAKSGLRKVSIQRKHKSIPESMDFAFGPSGSVFGIGINDSRDESGWPAIWGVVQRAGISGGAGNANQHQIRSDTLIDGVYHFRSGKWMKIE